MRADLLKWILFKTCYASRCSGGLYGLILSIKEKKFWLLITVVGGTVGHSFLNQKVRQSLF